MILRKYKSLQNNLSGQTKLCINENFPKFKMRFFQKKDWKQIDKNKENLNRERFQIDYEINKYQSELDGINNKKKEVQRFLNTVKNDKDVENIRLIELDKYKTNLQNKISVPSKKDFQKKELSKLHSQEVELKNKLKQLETIFVNEIQLSLGEEFKSDNLKENKEILQKKKIQTIEAINNLKKKYPRI